MSASDLTAPAFMGPATSAWAQAVAKHPAIPASYTIVKEGSNIYALPCVFALEKIPGTDASTVIQAAMDALTSGGKILVKSGTYTISTGLVPQYNNIQVFGEGPSTILQPASNFNLFSTPASTQIQHFRLSNLRIDGSLQTSGSAVTGTFLWSEFDHLKIGNIASTAITLTGFGDPWEESSHENLICHNYRLATTAAATAVIQLGADASNPYCADNLVFDNIIYRGQSGIIVYGGATEIFNNHIFAEGSVDATAKYNLYISGACRVHNNYLDDAGRESVYISIPSGKTVDFVSLKDNRINSPCRGANNTYYIVRCDVAGTLKLLSVKNHNITWPGSGNRAKQVLATSGAGTFTDFVFAGNEVESGAWVTDPPLVFGLSPTNAYYKPRNVNINTETILTSKTVNIAETTIAHGLHITPTNILPTMTSAGTVWRSKASDSTNIYLKADANGRTCDIYVSGD